MIFGAILIFIVKTHKFMKNALNNNDDEHMCIYTVVAKKRA